VTGLAPDDLSNTGTATGCVFAVAGSGASYTLTVTGCSASGTLAPQLAANTVADTAANAGPGTAVTGPALTLDRVAPTVGSFTTAVVSPTNSTSIAYALAFSESVTGLAPGDFSNAGTATGCTFTPSGSGTSYTLTVTTCSASGTLVPRLATSSMGDIAGNTGPVVDPRPGHPGGHDVHDQRAEPDDREHDQLCPNFRRISRRARGGRLR
jgi:hypothetical protein